MPENHLRLYVVFSAPLGLGAGGPHIRLLDERRPAGGRPVPAARRRPVERGPHALHGPLRPRARQARHPAETPSSAARWPRTAGYTLVIDAAWRDAAGQPLVAPFRREYRVGPPRERALDPAAWQLDVPGGGTQDALAVRFPVPLDYGLLQRALHVATEEGRPLAGEMRVEQGETRWTFTPRAPWRPGEYRLVAAATLEDAAGNRIGRPFEVDGAEGHVPERARGAVVPFRIGEPLVGLQFGESRRLDGRLLSWSPSGGEGRPRTVGLHSGEDP